MKLKLMMRMVVQTGTHHYGIVAKGPCPDCGRLATYAEEEVPETPGLRDEAKLGAHPTPPFRCYSCQEAVIARRNRRIRGNFTPTEQANMTRQQIIHELGVRARITARTTAWITAAK